MGLILASGSPQRRKLLTELGIPFKIVPSNVPENSREKDPRKLVVLLARRKALAVAKAHPKDVVLGSDTLVVCKGEILGKPRDRDDALRILKMLNGAWQKVYTGVAVAEDGGRKVLTGVAVSRVHARKLSEAKLLEYAGKHLDKAGGYAVQDRDDPFVDRIEGDYDNVVGLPLRVVKRLLYKSAGCSAGSRK